MKGLTTCHILAAHLVLFGFPALKAQHKGQGKSHMMYNPDAEITIKGTVENIAQDGADATSKMPMGMGTHLIVKTAQGNMEVILGPTKFLSSKGFTFAKGMRCMSRDRRSRCTIPNHSSRGKSSSRQNHDTSRQNR